MHPCSTFSDCCHLATPLNAEVQKNGKNWSFSPPRDYSINRSRRNFAGERNPYICYCTPNLALIGRRGLVQEPPKMSKVAQNCVFWPPESDTMNTFRWNLACKWRPWVCSSTRNLALIGTEAPKMSKFAHNCGFWPPEVDTNEHIQMKFRPVRVDLGSSLAHQIWPSWVKVGRYRSLPNIKNCPKLCFRPPEADTMNTFRWNL